MLFEFEVRLVDPFAAKCPHGPEEAPGCAEPLLLSRGYFRVVSTPTEPARAAEAAEMTTTVVIGSGLPGLAVATELSHRGISSIVVEGLECLNTGPTRAVMTDSGSLSERTELLRLLRGYATSHCLDIRHHTVASELCMVGYSNLLSAPLLRSKKWVVQTKNGVLLADTVVLTKYPQNQLRRFLHSMGIAIGRDLKTTLQSIGLYLVGVGELITPSTREIVRQAKLVSDTIVSQRILPAGRMKKVITGPLRSGVPAISG